MDTLIYTAHSHHTISRSKDIAIFVIRQGYIPIDPFLTLPPAVYDHLGFDEDDCVNMDINLLKHCNGLWVFGDKTPGVSKEIAWWEKNRLSTSIKYFNWDELCVS